MPKNTLKKENTEHHIMKVMTPFHGTFKLGIHCKVPPVYYMFDTANYVFPATVHKDTVPMSSQFRAKKKNINNVMYKLHCTLLHVKDVNMLHNH